MGLGKQKIITVQYSTRRHQHSFFEELHQIRPPNLYALSVSKPDFGEYERRVYRRVQFRLCFPFRRSTWSRKGVSWVERVVSQRAARIALREWRDKDGRAVREVSVPTVDIGYMNEAMKAVVTVSIWVRAN